MTAATAGSPVARALADYFRTIGAAALELAKALENTDAPPIARSLDSVSLGSLQRQVAESPLMGTDEGASPREITRSLGRDDEPNIRQALGRLQALDVAELISQPGPQRWRLTAPFRSAS